MNEQELYTAASRRADDKLGFYIHLAIYLIVNAILAAMNLMLFPSFHWFKFCLLGWGMGLLIHGFMVFVVGGLDLKERLVKREYNRLKQSTVLDDPAQLPR